MPAALSVENLQKSYGRNKAVNGISLEISRKEIFGLLGPNGAGKTTTIECIIGLRSADLGRVEINGLDALKNSRQVKDQLGVQLQETALHDKITPIEALHLFASLYSSPADPWKLLEQFALQDTARAKYETLSSGQKQRLAVALAMINRPMIVLLDEPTQHRRILVLDRLEGHELWVAARCERAVLVEHVRDAAAHAGGEVPARAAEHSDDAARHVFAAVVTDALDHRIRA